MDFRTTRRGDTVVVALDARLTVDNRQAFKQHMLGLLEDGARHFEVDLAQTDYLDSSGLGALVTVAKQIRAHNGVVHLVNMNEELTALFALTKLDTLFPGSGDGDRFDEHAVRPAPPVPPDGPNAGDARPL